MSKPSESLRNAASAIYDRLGRGRIQDTDIIADALERAIIAAKAEAYGETAMAIIDAIEPYMHVSSLHNYGPGGLSRVEEAEIRTGTFIMQDVTTALAVIRERDEVNTAHKNSEA